MRENPCSYDDCKITVVDYLNQNEFIYVGEFNSSTPRDKNFTAYLRRLSSQTKLTLALVHNGNVRVTGNINLVPNLVPGATTKVYTFDSANGDVELYDFSVFGLMTAPYFVTLSNIVVTGTSGVKAYVKIDPDYGN